jgi:hypothetical protein
MDDNTGGVLRLTVEAQPLKLLSLTSISPGSSCADDFMRTSKGCVEGCTTVNGNITDSNTDDLI